MSEIPKKIVDKIQSFSKWWDKHKSLYEAIGVKEEHAHIIWCSAIDSLIDGFSLYYRNK